ncbi:MAG: PP2C family protein-serine/threonine phosphatase, partial [bacterium]
ARDAEEAVDGMVFSFSDVTARRIAEQQLERYASELRDRNTQMEADLTMAREVQMGLLPNHLPTLPAAAPPEQAALRCARFYQPSTTVGGDFFHVQALSERAVGVFVCDVMGHGMRAALVTAIVRGLLEESRALSQDPGALITRLNQALVAILRPSGEFLFVSAVYAIVDLEQATVRMALAGHPAPLRIHASLTAPEILFDRAARGPALGVRETHSFATTTHPIQAGDRLLFYTDGLIEAENSAREEWGVERLRASLQTHAAQPLEAWISTVVAEAASFGDGRPFEDDVCVVGVEIVRLS